MIVDGGKGQLSAALDVMRNLGLEHVPLAGLAKQNEELFVQDVAEPIVLPRTSQALYLVQRIRDEAHRFAITYHRKVRAKAGMQCALDSIPGIGPKRKRALLRKFGSVKGIREAAWRRSRRRWGSRRRWRRRCSQGCEHGRPETPANRSREHVQLARQRIPLSTREPHRLAGARRGDGAIGLGLRGRDERFPGRRNALPELVAPLAPLGTAMGPAERPRLLHADAAGNREDRPDLRRAVGHEPAVGGVGRDAARDRRPFLGLDDLARRQGYAPGSGSSLRRSCGRCTSIYSGRWASGVPARIEDAVAVY